MLRRNEQNLESNWNHTFLLNRCLQIQEEEEVNLLLHILNATKYYASYSLRVLIIQCNLSLGAKTCMFTFSRNNTNIKRKYTSQKIMIELSRISR